MSPRRKTYAVAEAVVASDPDLEPIVVRFDDQPGRPPQVFDFVEFADFPQLFRAFAGAFRRHHDAAQRVTREGAFGGIRKFFAFLREQRAAGRVISEPGHLETELLKGYAAWLQRRSLALRSQAHYYGITVRILGELRRSRPALFGHIAVPRRQFPGVGRQRRLHPMPKLDTPTMRALRDAAWKEVQAVWADFCRGQTLLAEAVERLEWEQRPPDPRNLGELLVYIEREHGGVLPSLSNARRVPSMYAMIERHGGAEAVARYLYATPETLAPFAILIGADTFANSAALRLFRRDCVRPDPLFEGSYLVRWHKARSTGEQQRQLSGLSPSSVPRLVERLLALTQRLVPEAGADERQRLFLCRLRMGRQRSGVVADHALLAACRRLVARHNLRGPDGTPLYFHLGMLRPTGLTLLYRQRGDLLGVSRAAGHSSLGVTVRYVLDPETERDHDRLIAGRQDALARMIDGPVQPAEGATEPIGLDSQAMGFTCGDPVAGRGPRARPGELCPEWLWPFTDPGLVIPNDPHHLARALQLQRHLREAWHQMRSERFDLIYRPLLSLIDDDILPRFTDVKVLQEAELLVDALAPLPDLVTA